MNLLVPILALFFFQSAVPSSQQGSLRNAFRTAAESVVDQATHIDPAEDEASYAISIRQLKQQQSNLSVMAADDREQEIVSESSNLIFAVSTCHLQAQGDAAKAASCRPQVEHAAHGVEMLLGRHRVNGTWVDGPPS